MRRRSIATINAIVVFLLCLLLSGAALTVSAQTDYYFRVEDDHAIATEVYTGDHYFTEEEIHIPAFYGKYPVTKIGKSFPNIERHTNITALSMPDSITHIEDFVFSPYLGRWEIFTHYNSFTDFTLPESLVSIGKRCFYCPSARTTIPKNVSYIGAGSFSRIKGLTVHPENTHYRISGSCLIETATNKVVTALVGTDTLNIPSDEGLTAIGETAFYFAELPCVETDRGKVRSITIPEGIERIELRAFWGCWHGELYLPSTLTYIGDEVFLETDGPANIYYNGTTNDWEKITIGAGNPEFDTYDRIHFLKNCETHTFTIESPMICTVCGHTERDNTLVEVNGMLKPYREGQVYYKTDLFEYNGTTYYVTNGAVDFSFTGIFNRYFVKNGIVQEHLQQPSFTVTPHKSMMRVSWNPVEGATYYIVCSADYVNGVWSDYKYEHIYSGDTTFLHYPQQDATKVRYVLYACNEKQTSLYHTPLSLNRTPATLESPSFEVENVNYGIQVSWQAVEGATQYHVYISYFYNGQWQLYSRMLKTTDLSCTLGGTSGHDYKFTVYAVGGEQMSNYQTAHIITRLDPTKPVVSNTKNGVLVKWNRVAGATSYKVYRSLSVNGKWEDYQLYKNTTDLSFYDLLPSGTGVRYIVYAYARGSYGPYHTGVYTKYLASPDFKATNTAQGVHVSWKPVNGAKTYEVYRSVFHEAAGAWSAFSLYKTTTDTAFTDSFTSGTQVRYTVYARNGEYYSPYKTAQYVTYLAQPQVMLTNTKSGVYASWQPVRGAANYKIYRSIATNGVWGAYTLYRHQTGCTFTDPLPRSTNVRYIVYAYSKGSHSAYQTGAYIRCTR